MASGEISPESAANRDARLAGFTVAELALELLHRAPNLIDGGGRLIKPAHDLGKLLMPRVCVDGAAARINDDGAVELMAIHRGTGFGANRLALVGGGIGLTYEDGEWVPESIAEALARHFYVDLGLDIEPLGSWQRPDYVEQDMSSVKGKIRPDFSRNEDARHLLALRYLVRITNPEQGLRLGRTDYGGQEALGVKWFSRAAMPDNAQFGYNHEKTYHAFFPLAEEYLHGHAE